MIKYDEACKIAFDYYKKNGKIGLCEANDLGDSWLFAGGDPDAVDDGGYSITVDKGTGKIEPFFLPDKENFKRLDRATPVDIPDEYKYKHKD